MSSPEVVVWIGTRADLFPLEPVLRALVHTAGLDTSAVVTPDVATLIDGLSLGGLTVRPLTTPLVAGGPGEQTRVGPDLAAELTAELARVDPAAFVVLGDRWELLYAVPPAVLLGIPVVHLHGGEVTEGAIDDRVRHAITKLADLHCVSTLGAARRLRQLGEPANRVVVTGAPSLDRLAGTSALTDAEIAQMLGRDIRRPLVLATYHPATAADEDPGTTVANMLAGLLPLAGTIVVTHPGLDAGRELVLERLALAAAEHPQIIVVPSLGPAYPRMMAASDVMVGNSSSGILEAATLSLPVVDVGGRQAGRERGRNVITVGTSAEEVAGGVRRALDPAFRATWETSRNPYGDGHASERIVTVIRRAVAGVPVRKPFVDHPSSAQ